MANYHVDLIEDCSLQSIDTEPLHPTSEVVTFPLPKLTAKDSVPSPWSHPPIPAIPAIPQSLSFHAIPVDGHHEATKPDMYIQAALYTVEVTSKFHTRFGILSLNPFWFYFGTRSNLELQSLGLRVLKF
ncbi:hypothetical protein E4U40_004201 [Claviceps sp. LM458 group G5]|nr:hypothetical protein E4U40_004201 [Claviceps sp. LM458 group G5]